MLPFIIESPKFMTLQMQSILGEAAPDYVLPVLREGIADGSIQADHPEELSEVLLILANLWLHPIFRPKFRTSHPPPMPYALCPAVWRIRYI